MTEAASLELTLASQEIDTQVEDIVPILQLSLELLAPFSR